MAFDDDQVSERGRYFDTDAAAVIVEQCCEELGRRVWTELFAFRPTFELVARDVYRRLSGRLVQLAFVQLRDETFGVTTRYSP